MFLRGVTAEKFGFKNGEGITDLVDSLILPKEKVTDEIATLGVMSDFQPAQKQIESFPGDDLLFVIDKTQQYGEMFLLCYTEEAREEFERKVREAAEAIEAQARAEEEARLAAEAAEYARLNVVYEDKPIEPRPWVTETSIDTTLEVDAYTFVPYREAVSIEISRPKDQTGKSVKLYDRNADVSGISEFRGVKDPNFKSIVEKDSGFQAAAPLQEQAAQTTWNRLVNKSVQYTSSTGTDAISDNKEALLMFLEKALVTIENSLQQNESVDIFNDTFVITGDNDDDSGDAKTNELKELKNFGDPNYSKFKSLVAMDWVPHLPGMLAVSCVDNISFDQRTVISGKIKTSHLLVWDFRQLVKPSVVMSAQNEILCFRFNRAKKQQGLVVGGCITGQVCLWNIGDALKTASKKKGDAGDDEDAEGDKGPIAPVLVSSIDYSHKKAVSDIMWLPADVQINYRGNLVAAEHLDGQQHQFVTISGDGMIAVWDIRFRQIAAEELKHIGRPKHVPVEKQQAKGEEPKLLWAPIFKAPLKRAEGVGELSLNRLFSPHASLSADISTKTEQSGDVRSHLVVSTEEGDLMYVDLTVAKAGATDHGGGDDEDDGKESGGREFVRWTVRILFCCYSFPLSLIHLLLPACLPARLHSLIPHDTSLTIIHLPQSIITLLITLQVPDHVRPAVAVCMSPFFPDIALTVADACFHLWRIGQEQPLYVSPNHSHRLSCGAWSPTRPSVIILADATGHLQTWDFSDTSSKPSLELKATHEHISSMEFMPGATARQQLLAIGDDVGTLHVYELPRGLTRPVPREKALMGQFIEREWAHIQYLANVPPVPGFDKRDVRAFAGASGGEGNGGEGGDDDDDGESEGKTPEPAAAAPPAADMGGLGGGDSDEEDAASTAAAKAAAAKQAAREQAKKEEEEFLKMEAAFIAELGLSKEEVPEGLQGSWKAPE
jgi:WD40 repeat protein